jgi:1-acyl-sn-glycerol-3-phosphate acyltransferase
MKGAYGFFHRLLAVPFRFIFRIHVTGQENEPEAGDGAYLVCANHISGWDVIWVGVAFRRMQIHFMSKAELFKIPLLGGLIRSLGAYPVNRSIADVTSVRTTLSLLGEGECVCMFPQGTRYPGRNPAETEVKSGAGMISYRSGAPVLPVFIKMKNFRPTVFGRKDVIIGKPIPNSTIAGLHDGGAEYNRISRYIYGEICALGGLTVNGGPGKTNE